MIRLFSFIAQAGADGQCHDMMLAPEFTKTKSWYTRGADSDVHYELPVDEVQEVQELPGDII